MCDLNAEHLIAERRERTEIWGLLHTAFTVKGNRVPQLAADMAEALHQQAEKMIPKIPHLPKSATRGSPPSGRATWRQR